MLPYKEFRCRSSLVNVDERAVERPSSYGIVPYNPFPTSGVVRVTEQKGSVQYEQRASNSNYNLFFIYVPIVMPVTTGPVLDEVDESQTIMLLPSFQSHSCNVADKKLP